MHCDYSHVSTNAQHFHRRGVVVPLVAVILPVIMILAAFAVNLSYIELTRTELRIAADAATRAAGRTLIDTNDLALSRSSCATSNHEKSRCRQCSAALRR